MRVHLFGATASPCCAAFSLHQATSNFGGSYEPIALSTIEQCLYVNDCLTPVPDIETGIKLVDDL